MKTNDAAAPKQEQAVSVAIPAGDTSRVLRNPRLTEKATDMIAHNVYAFDVAPRATKPQIAAAVKELYKVTPVAVRIVTVPSKPSRHPRSGRTGRTASGKKAYVQLAEGETISLM